MSKKTLLISIWVQKLQFLKPMNDSGFSLQALDDSAEFYVFTQTQINTNREVSSLKLVYLERLVDNFTDTKERDQD